MNYRRIKLVAKEAGVSVKDLIALAPQNDPFYVGSKSELAKAQWFAALWQQFGYGQGVHLRRIHYQAMSRTDVIKPDGQPYENTENDWNYLNQAAKYARYLKLVPAEHFVDRRNPEAIIHAIYYGPDECAYEDPTPGWEIEQEGWDEHRLPDLPTLPDIPEELPDLPGLDAFGYIGAQQAYHVEIWGEKTTMNDILIPLCKQHRVNLITGAGELSITAVLDLMERIRKADRPARILYISDYDPAGLGMPISVARKIEYFQRAFGYDDLDIALQPIMLTAEQVAEYDLPRKPGKPGDRRKANWEAAHGYGVVELDALEALYPGTMAELVKAAVCEYYDPALDSKAYAVRNALQDALDAESETIIEAYQGQIDVLRAEYTEMREGFAETRSRFAALIASFQSEIDAHHDRLAGIRERGQDLYAVLLDELGAVDLDLDEYPVPEPDLPPEQAGLLYVSTRGYLDQIGYYKDYRSGNGHG